jgi:hypothetical protein
MLQKKKSYMLTFIEKERKNLIFGLVYGKRIKELLPQINEINKAEILYNQVKEYIEV